MAQSSTSSAIFPPIWGANMSKNGIWGRYRMGALFPMGGKVASKVWKEGFQQVEADHPMGGSKGYTWG
jgi:hypothetical protein